jgi:hypothetical protein
VLCGLRHVPNVKETFIFAMKPMVKILFVSNAVIPNISRPNTLGVRYAGSVSWLSGGLPPDQRRDLQALSRKSLRRQEHAE